MKKVFDFLVMNIPVALRNSNTVMVFLHAVSVPLTHAKNTLDGYFLEMNLLVKITPQVYLLERLLNAKIHETNKKIIISDGIDTPAFYFSEVNAASMCYFDNGNYFAYIDPYGTDIDFLVLIPQYYEGNTNTINKIVFYLEKYKLFSTTYKKVFYI